MTRKSKSNRKRVGPYAVLVRRPKDVRQDQAPNWVHAANAWSVRNASGLDILIRQDIVAGELLHLLPRWMAQCLIAATVSHEEALKVLPD
jgi:hypothetical protein